VAFAGEPGPGDRLAVEQALGHRDDLLADQHAQQADQGDRGRGRRTDVDQSVEQAGQDAGAEGNQVHGPLLLLLRHGWRG
jgi:hypothetical protein